MPKPKAAPKPTKLKKQASKEMSLIEANTTAETFEMEGAPANAKQKMSKSKESQLRRTFQDTPSAPTSVRAAQGS